MASLFNIFSGVFEMQQCQNDLLKRQFRLYHTSAQKPAMFCAARETINSEKAAYWKIFANCLSDQGLIFRIQLNRKQVIWLVNGQRTWIHIFFLKKSMTSTHMKRCLISLSGKNKTTKWYHLLPLRMITIKKKCWIKIASLMELWRISIPLHSW